jgi:hypothetical protein
MSDQFRLVSELIVWRVNTEGVLISQPVLRQSECYFWVRRSDGTIDRQRRDRGLWHESPERAVIAFIDETEFRLTRARWSLDSARRAVDALEVRLESARRLATDQGVEGATP